MPTFTDYLRLIQAHGGTQAGPLARAIQDDRALQSWERTTLIVQLGLTLAHAAASEHAPDRQAGVMPQAPHQQAGVMPHAPGRQSGVMPEEEVA